MPYSVVRFFLGTPIEFMLRLGNITERASAFLHCYTAQNQSNEGRSGNNAYDMPVFHFAKSPVRLDADGLIETSKSLSASF